MDEKIAAEIKERYESLYQENKQIIEPLRQFYVRTLLLTQHDKSVVDSIIHMDYQGNIRFLRKIYDPSVYAAIQSCNNRIVNMFDKCMNEDLSEDEYIILGKKYEEIISEKEQLKYMRDQGILILPENKGMFCVIL